MSKKYIFVDRDGTLINEPADNYQVDSLEKLSLEPMVIPALLSLQSMGYSLVMITNQDGLGTASFPQESFDVPHQKMMEAFSSQGVTFEEVLICTHLPDEKCRCRKPETGLVDQYMRERSYELSTSVVIGDRETDIELAKRMGIKGVLYNRDSNGWQQIVSSLTGKGRTALIERSTNETRVSVEINLDENDPREISTGIGFFDHMLDQIATHAGFSMIISVDGDLEIDDHHTMEDTGIVLGQAIRQALGEKKGIQRFGFALPMDEASAQCLLDLSGRPFIKFDAKFDREHLGTMSTEMVEHFFQSLAFAMHATVHLSAVGENTHHKVESLFKCFGRALGQAIRQDGDSLPSSKGIL
ncbi:MAG: bifunctional histidinol-phosphatase/imidazoleglycerol-phosphate dehydratase HisB [Rhodothermales bacterium]|nr:bifunctional histidinol-phosphatase/imidazoleglycerol-phosphate dehydratase HisB [Rhodothermales bacterium]